MTPDSELLARFARTNAEDVFAELVKRHVNLVYSAALRQVNGDAHLAQDVAQAVFTDLARKAGSLARGRDASSPLTGWLYTAAHHAATKMVRGENRRRGREETFMRESTNENVPEVGHVTPCAPDWEKIRPALDDAMHELKETDRDAILMRYFENQPFAEVGVKLGLNENAARMRVERALEKLRNILARRGIAATAALASVISANAVQLAPASLAATLATASIISAGTGTFTLMKILTATKLKLAVSALVVAGATAALVVQHQTQKNLRVGNESLTQQVAQLKADNESLSNRLAAAGDSKSLSDEQFNELLKLRGEVTRLRGNTYKPASVLTVSSSNTNQNNETRRQALKMAEQANREFSIESRLLVLKQRLHLTPEQEAAARDILTRKYGTDDYEQAKSLDPDLAAWLTPDQINEAQKLIEETLQNTSQRVIRQSAEDNLLDLQLYLGLDRQQQDKALPVLFEYYQQVQEGQSVALLKSEFSSTNQVLLNQKLNALKAILTDEQFAIYHKYIEQTSKAEQLLEASQEKP